MAAEPSPRFSFTYEHALVFITGLGFIVLSDSFSKLALLNPAAGWMTALCDVGALVLVAVALMRLHLAQRQHAYIFVISLAAIVVFTSLQATAGTALPSDEVGLTAAAAKTVTQGANPYTVDYLHTDPQIAAQPSSWFTPTFSGTRVSELAYPAGTFLVLAPLVAAFGAGALTDLYPLLLLFSIALAWLIVPPNIRPLVTVLMFLMTASGVLTGTTDAMYLPFVILAVWRWPRFVMPDVGTVARIAGPLALGVACSMKQNAWVLAPFLLLGVVLEARARDRGWIRAALIYTALAVVPFLAVNVPFMVADWHAWWRAVTLPFTLHTVLYGNGLAAIPLAGAAGGDHLELLSVAAAAVLVATFVFAALQYPRARSILTLLPVAALTVSTRSLSAYLYFLLVPALVGAVTLPALPAVHALSVRASTVLRGAAGAATLAAAGVIGFVLLQRPPLAVAVAATRVDGSVLTSVTVSVTNRSARTITPSFFAAPTDVDAFTLNRAQGPGSLDAGATATYELHTLPGDNGRLKAGDIVRIVALADQPESISQSDVYRLGVGPAGS